MKYELIKKILNSPVTILDYLILEHIKENTFENFLEDAKFSSQIFHLKENEYISNNNKLTLKGKQLLDELNQFEEKSDFYSQLHKSLQDELVNLTGKKQKMLQGKYGFIPNPKDLKLRLQKVIKEYQLNDLQKVEKVLLLYVEKCNKARFEYVSTIEYYILKDKSSKLATDYENYNEEEIVYEDNTVNI